MNVVGEDHALHVVVAAQGRKGRDHGKEGGDESNDSSSRIVSVVIVRSIRFRPASRFCFEDQRCAVPRSPVVARSRSWPQAAEMSRPRDSRTGAV
jgi:hypothetical protein